MCASIDMADKKERQEAAAVRYGDMSLCILAGGQSRRMGRDKNWLPWMGSSFIEHLLDKAKKQGFREILLCVDETSIRWNMAASCCGARLVTDERSAYGPLEGLRRALSVMQSAYALVLSCDMPFFDFDRLAPLREHVPECMAAIPVAGGRQQFLAGVYSKWLLPYVEQAIEAGGHSLYGVLHGKAPVAFVDMTSAAAHFFNVNTPAAYRLALGRAMNLERRVPVVSVTAMHSNSGKTTFIERLLPFLAERGLRAGVVKSDVHALKLDAEGTDSFRFMEAGAQAVAVVSDGQLLLLQRTQREKDLLAAAQRMQEVDLVFIESRAHGAAPRLEILPEGESLLRPENELAALVSSGGRKCAGLLQFSAEDTEAAYAVVCFLIGREDGSDRLFTLD